MIPVSDYYETQIHSQKKTGKLKMQRGTYNKVKVGVMLVDHVPDNDKARNLR
jgi:hypothetical protein